jgi:hypothetical protein
MPGDDRSCSPKNQKAGSRPAALQRSFRPRREPGRSERSTRARRLLLLRLLSLLSLFCLLRFLSHSILIWVNGWKRDTRHARRRANLATSSVAIPTDSRAAAPHCHAGVITLSTAVMRFDAVLAPRCAPRLRIFPGAGRERSQHRPPARVNDAPTRRCILSRSSAAARHLHHFKTTASIASPGVRVR